MIPKDDEEEYEDGLDENHLDEGEEEDDDGEGDLEIDLDADDDDDDESAPADNKAWAEMRVQNKELLQTVNELKTQVSEVTRPEVPQQNERPVNSHNADDPMNWTEDQWDEYAKNDWKGAVDKRAEIQARKIHTTAATNSAFNEAQEKSKNDVLVRHPELGDDNSEKTKIYKNIVTANPEYIHAKKGPEMAMYEMENYMEQHMGYKREDIVKAEQRVRKEESDRGNRVALTSTVGRNVSSGNKVILTKDEQEFCDLQGINPKTYASNKKQLAKAGRGGVQL